MAEAQERIESVSPRDEQLGVNQTVRERLQAKLRGKPSFLPDDFTAAERAKLERPVYVQLVASADLLTRFGMFKIYGFYDHREEKEVQRLFAGM